MASAPGMFFAGIGTAALLIGGGFGGGVLLGKAAVDVPQARTAAAQDSLPSARVVLSTTRTNQPVQATPEPTPPPQAKPEPAVEPIPLADVQGQDREGDKQAARHAEKEKKQIAKKAAERERRKRYAAQKARQEAPRRQQQQQEQELEQQQDEGGRRPQQPSLLAFDRNEGPTEQINFFGN